MGPILSVEEARQRILNDFIPVEPEKVHITQCTGRVLAEDITSTLDFPHFDNSSMDGFAVRSVDVNTANKGDPVVLKVIADIPAGQVSTVSLGTDEAIRIMTGAPLPAGADAIVPIEDTDHYHGDRSTQDRLPGKVRIFKGFGRGGFIRPKGEDIRSGEVVLTKNVRLRPQDIGLLAMLGIAEVVVFRHPRVALLSTGDELIPVDTPLQPGKIHDSNAYTLTAMIIRDGCEVVGLGIAPDREEAVREIIASAIAANADLLLSTAGVSVGAFDFVRQVIQKDGNLVFWRVNMRPGKPLAFGHYRRVPFIGLPGNPVSAFIGYEVFVRPALMKLSGLPEERRQTVQVKLMEDVHSDGRESYLRAIVKFKEGRLIAKLTGHQGSGNLRSLVQANALLIIPSGVKSLPVGAEASAWLLDERNNG